MVLMVDISCPNDFLSRATGDGLIDIVDGIILSNKCGRRSHCRGVIARTLDYFFRFFAAMAGGSVNFVRDDRWN